MTLRRRARGAFLSRRLLLTDSGNRIDDCSPLARLANSHILRHHDRRLYPLESRRNFTDRESRLGRYARGAEWTAVKQERSEHGGFIWSCWQRRHSPLNCSAIATSRSIRESPKTNSGDPAIHRIAQPTLPDLAVCHFHRQRRLKPRETTRDSEVIERRAPDFPRPRRSDSFLGGATSMLGNLQEACVVNRQRGVRRKRSEE